MPLSKEGQSPARHKGFLIVFEGIDGAGKTTQAKILAENLTREGFETCMLKEPTSGEWGTKIKIMSRDGRTLSPREEFRYFYEDRKEDVRDNINPALEEGKVVVLDRYYYSNMAYQGAKGLDQTYIEEENLKIAPKPDLVILLDIDVVTAHHRIINFRKGQPNHFEQRLKPVRENFLEIAKSHSGIKVIDGRQSIDNISSDVLTLVLPRVEARIEKRIINYNG